MEEKLDLILKKLNELEEGQKQLSDGQKHLEEGQVQLNKRVGNIESDMKVIKSKLDENTQLIRSVRDRQEETDAKLESLSMDVYQLHGELSSLKEGQERQDKILESLALRSLEQETELRELKRA